MTEPLIEVLRKMAHGFREHDLEPPTAVIVSPEARRKLLWEMNEFRLEGSPPSHYSGNVIELRIDGMEVRDA